MRLGNLRNLICFVGHVSRVSHVSNISVKFNTNLDGRVLYVD